MKNSDFDLGEALLNLEQAENRKLLKVVSIEQLLSLEIPPRDNILTPIITSQSISMLYGIRGVGKTHFVIGIALAVSGGGCFLKWRAEKPYNVLYIDGEMPAVVVQERFSRHIVSLDYEITGSLNIITPDLQKYGMPNLSTVDGQAAIEQHLDNVKLVILDNLSTLCRSGKENEGESWLPVQEWALRLRSKGISILFIHHAGKAGLQRGTSRREDVLDTVINLRRPADYHPSEGAKFEIHFEKARGLYGDDVKPFEAMLTEKDGRLLWTYKDVEESLTEKVAHLFNEGFKPGEIAEELNIRSKGTVSKHRKKALARGLIKDANDVQCKKFPVSHI